MIETKPLKTIKFRPLRIIKKTGLITVASYTQWRNIKTADYNLFNLIIDDSYKSLPDDALVFNHKGELLYWIPYNPEEIELISGYELIAGETYYPKLWKTEYNHYSATGLDCDGVPTFSHQTGSAIYAQQNWREFKHLTVKTVKFWFGWFLFQLENSSVEYI